jgi:hypothetical protein
MKESTAIDSYIVLSNSSILLISHLPTDEMTAVELARKPQLVGTVLNDPVDLHGRGSRGTGEI